MKKQFELLMYTGIIAGAVMTSCKTPDSVVVYDDQARPKVYKATKGDVATQQINRTYTRNDQNSKVIYSANEYTAPIQSNQPVYQAPVKTNSCPMAAVQPVQNYQDNSSAQYMPQIVDMTTARNNQNQPSVYNYNQTAQPVIPNYGGYNYVQVYNTHQSNRTNQSVNGRNRSLDNNLYNRPNAYTLTDDMYTPEYRSMMYNRQNRSAYNQQPVQNDPYTGLMTVENGNVVPYNNQPRIIQQQEYYVQPQVQYQEPRPQKYVVPAEPQQQYYYPQPQSQAPDNPVYSYSQTEVRQIEEGYPATLYFKNGAKLTGTLLNIDNSACMFKMAEGHLVNFATKDILKIERR